jgi:phosphate-selective porin OprO/OprP
MPVDPLTTPSRKARRAAVAPVAFLAVAWAAPSLAADEAPVPPPVAQAAAPAPAPAAPTDVDQRLRELEETVRKQQEVIRKLQDTLETLQKPAAPPPPNPAQPPPAARPPADSTLRLQLRGVLHMDTRVFPSGGGRTSNESILMRRVRPVLSGSVSRYAEFMIQPGFDEGRASLFDAYADVRASPRLQLRFGKFKAPFSLERLQSAPDLGFVERSVAQNLAPNRDVGVMLHGEVLEGRLAYAVAVLNGEPDGVNVDGDAGRDKDFAGRVFAQPFRGRKGAFLEGLGVGLAATHGARDEPFQVAYRAADRSQIFAYRSDTSFAGDVTRLAPQIHHYYGPWGFMGEAYLNSEAVKRGTTQAQLRHSGWFLQGSYVLTGEKAGFRNVTPRRPFEPEKGHWGAFELAFRYSKLDMDGDTFRLGLADPLVSARSARAWTLGLNWYLDRALKLQLNYEHTDFNAPLRFGSGPSDHQDVILTRFQLAY